MQETLFALFQQHPGWAVAISLLVSTLVAVLGLVPSVFVTAANLAFFGFGGGLAVSFAGEAVGAVISFLLYRRGFRQRTAAALTRFPRLERLTAAQGREAFGLVLSLRLLPFVPSGLVTFAAAVGRISTGSFILASTIGKAPALVLEAYSVYEVGRFSGTGKVILVLAALALLFFVIRKTFAQPSKP
ncbi:TVP38/TMEM64 family protein [Flaviaesturariibacter flavus]|uniref:TVP38/TMEM64 family membrane protein n=1 Tax=Flaviaesturariibacter flavus TaxID=2502780 RepID=A0A4R1BAJ8_9BACT|nr:VTT domain-containing protein [Flaviaesturariibacter flavus]TCJ13996.1 TVP38/TMEM64 family protein [Flaviaesturariibacter flavus]